MWSVRLCVLLCAWPWSALMQAAWGGGPGWICCLHCLFHSTRCRCALYSGGPPTRLFSVDDAYFFRGITYFHLCCWGLLVHCWYPPKGFCRIRAWASLCLREQSLHGWCRGSRRGHFVEMHDLLGDNIALTQNFKSAANYFPIAFLETAPPAGGVFPFFMALLLFNLFSSPGTRPIHLGSPGVCQTDFAEVLHHGRWDWLNYDCLFWQQAALDLSLHWGYLHPSLMASTVLSQRSGTGSFCGLCRVVTIHPLIVQWPSSGTQCARVHSQDPLRSACLEWWQLCYYPRPLFSAAFLRHLW